MNELRKTIVEHPFFSGMDAEHLETIAEAASMAKFNAGAILFREGEPADRLFLITHGSVVLEADDLPMARSRCRNLRPAAFSAGRGYSRRLHGTFRRARSNQP